MYKTNNDALQRPSRRSVLRALGAIGLAGLGGSSLAGCGSSGELGDDDPGATDEPADALSVIGASQPNPGRGFTKLLDDFESQQDVSIDYQFFPANEFVALFTAAKQSDDPIDVLNLNGQSVRRYATDGTLQPLDVDYLDRFRPLGRETFTIDGEVYALPIGHQGGFKVIYNKALLDEIGADYPQTYADLRDVAAELKQRDIAAFTHGGRDVFVWPVYFFATYAQTTKNQSEEKTIELLRGNGSFTDPEVVEALDLILAFSRDGLFSEDVLSLDTDGARSSMIRGRAAFMLVAGHGALAEAESVDARAAAPPRLVSDESVIPSLPGGVSGAVGIHSDISDQRREAALELIDFLTTDESSSYLAQDLDQPFSVNVNGEGSQDEIAQEMLPLLEDTTVYLDWYWPPEVTTAFQEGIQAGVAGSKDAETIASEIQATWEDVLADGYEFG